MVQLENPAPNNQYPTSTVTQGLNDAHKGFGFSADQLLGGIGGGNTGIYQQQLFTQLENLVPGYFQQASLGAEKQRDTIAGGFGRAKGFVNEQAEGAFQTNRRNLDSAFGNIRSGLASSGFGGSSIEGQLQLGAARASSDAEINTRSRLAGILADLEIGQTQAELGVDRYQNDLVLQELQQLLGLGLGRVGAQNAAQGLNLQQGQLSLQNNALGLSKYTESASALGDVLGGVFGSKGVKG